MSESFETILYNRSAATTRVHGILAIIFGGIGVLLGVLFMFLFLIAGSVALNLEDVVSSVALFIFTLVLFVIPHIYLIIAGVHLVKEPAPKVARTLIIINLIIGVLSNLVILVISIVNLIQMSDYERGYTQHKRTHGK